jgi:Hemerythrin HHE cation binding domain
MNATPAPSIDERLLAEHRRIRALTQQFESATALRELLNVLAEARPVFAEHFRAEEADDGFYDRVRSTTSTHMERVDRLEREHKAFLADVDGLVARSETCLASMAQILTEARSLAERLRKHEVAEDQIVADALYGDTGQGD